MSVLSVDLFIAALRLATPIALVAVGETFSELAGVINVGVEGITVAGALVAAMVAFFTQSPWLALAAAVAVGMVLGALHALWSVYLRADHVVSGVAVNLLVAGFALFSTRIIWGWRGTSAAAPTLNPWFLVGAMLAVVAIAQVFIFRTPWGLRLRVVGEHPRAADTAGINVYRARLLFTVVNGALCGLAGAFLFNNLGRFTDGMVGGRGFIGIAAMVVGNYRPLPALLAAYLFGFVDALQMRLQAYIPSQFSLMLPYILTVVVLAGFLGRAKVPKALGKPYVKERG
ncbi:ABC transporter permease [Candidatus Bipolaricaulota bacterium]|nr:ABC transporter permease [Candidatus Bipolaricaulota bacterium]